MQKSKTTFGATTAETGLNTERQPLRPSKIDTAGFIKYQDKKKPSRLQSAVGHSRVTISSNKNYAVLFQEDKVSKRISSWQSSNHNDKDPIPATPLSRTISTNSTNLLRGMGSAANLT